MFLDQGSQKEIMDLVEKFNNSKDSIEKIRIDKDILSKFKYQRKLALLSKTRTDYLFGDFYDV